MTKLEFVRTLAADLEISISKADDIYTAFCAIIKAEFAKPDALVPLHTVGKLVRIRTAPRTVTTPDGKTHDIPSHGKIVFRPSIEVKQQLRG